MSYTRIKDSLTGIVRLSVSLAVANFKLRNEGSYLGLFWYVLNPLALFFIIPLIRNQMFVGNDIAHFPLYLLIGLLMHNFFVQLIGAAITIIPSNGSIIKSISIPYEALVLSRAMQSIFSHMIEIVLLILCALYFHVHLIGIIPYLGVFALLAVGLLGLSFMFATMGAYITDLNNVWIVLSQLLFFVTPIFHMPAEGSVLYMINIWNPLAYFIEAAREMFIYGRLPEGTLVLQLVLMSAGSLIVGLYIFEMHKRRFAELV